MVVASMIGSGAFAAPVLLAQDLGARGSLLAWTIGALLALAGAYAYAAVVALVPRSGGEYRFLSDLAHPFLGRLAGWASLLIGFSVPMAVDAFVIGSLAATSLPGLDPRILAAAALVLVTGLHAAGGRLSDGTQAALVLAKVGLVVWIVAAGGLVASPASPIGSPEINEPPASLAALARGVIVVSFALSGWNAAAYLAGEFRAGPRDVRRSMLAGCALVGVLLLLLQWAVLRSLDPLPVSRGSTSSGLAFGVVTARLPAAALAVVLLSSLSAATLAGSRVCAAMARDGALPPLLGGTGGPARRAVWLQGGLAAVLLASRGLRECLEAAGMFLLLSTAATVLTLFRPARGSARRPTIASRVAAGLCAAGSLLVVAFGFRPSAAAALALATVLALAAYFRSTERWPPAHVALRARAIYIDR